MNDSQYLQHYGILGQKWGVRRYQNLDGTLTPAGKKRYQKILDLTGQEKLKKYGKTASELVRLSSKHSDEVAKFYETLVGNKEFEDRMYAAMKTVEGGQFGGDRRNTKDEFDYIKDELASNVAGQMMPKELKDLGHEVFAKTMEYNEQHEELVSEFLESSEDERQLANKVITDSNPSIANASWYARGNGEPDDSGLQKALNKITFDEYQKRYPLSHSSIERGQDVLAHYGIPKMRWGVRRFQNEDGSLTEAGKIRYGKESNKRPSDISKLLSKKKPEKQSQSPPVPREYTNEEIIKSGNAKLILDNADRLTTQELQAARTRLNELNSIRNMTIGEIRQKKEHVIKRGAKLIAKAIADQTADSIVKVTKGATVYGIKKGVNKFVPDGEWKKVIVSSLNAKDNKQQKEDKK